ncbi:iron-containing alcohol dehydrogenase [Tumebacillus flagellatus]|uniref:Butanol dehydrogenase n=1 Tax=Tumebacillus flagellatus TaxID=1157490 RepID=A0A074LL52_9BACL|nr:iron-containing alcohol dehydrogenase [Tumebacillus flagellatus]KEO81285.1 butanol dehydrogenase [Tumebacillus flagellatus]
MENFTFYNPTRLIFGRDTVAELKNEVPKYGKNVLLVYGGGSIQKSGLYDKVVSQLKELDINLFELPGVEPNPRLATVHKGVEICKRENIDFLLAVGGGSVIDCTKAIAAGAKYDGDAWDFISHKVMATDALPFGTVLTLAATGSEMNAGSVITNWETKEKLGWGSEATYPRFSILDPQNTFTVPRNHTIYGMVDMMAHVLENYMSHSPNTPLQERFLESILRTVIETAPKLLENLESYELRETILYSGTMALNGMTNMGMNGDWASHNIEHAVSAVYDIPHGGGLAILVPNKMKYAVEKGVGVSRFVQLAVRVFGVDPAGKSDNEVALEGIERLRAFWTSMEAPSRLADYDIDDSQLDVMVEKTMHAGPFGGFQTLDRADVKQILQMSL